MERRAVREDELWGRSLAGDGQSFGVLFERHGGRVFRHACRVVASRHDAEDVTAAAFLELWRRRRDVRLVEGSVLPWLLVTTGNLARNSVRSTRRYREFIARLPHEGTAPDAAEVALGRSVLGLDADLRAALLGLDEVDLHLVALVALEDYPIAEAARVLKLTPAAAKSRLHRARHRLRGVLGPKGVVPEPNATAGGAL